LRGDNAKFGKRRIADEPLVGIDFDVGRMIDGQQAHAIEVHGSIKRKLRRPFFSRTLFAGTFRYSSGSGTLRSPGAIQ